MLVSMRTEEPQESVCALQLHQDLLIESSSLHHSKLEENNSLVAAHQYHRRVEMMSVRQSLLVCAIQQS